jgi:hypothetical protein
VTDVGDLAERALRLRGIRVNPCARHRSRHGVDQDATGTSRRTADSQHRPRSPTGALSVPRGRSVAPEAGPRAARQGTAPSRPLRCSHVRPTGVRRGYAAFGNHRNRPTPALRRERNV